ncbi:hypothetical protein L1987_56122 [Smallanthus sonchifolius]|uniref:Uncharacterized protein n=1 Tax=Smallanthus sonchifolius TaxID=185202 RepID=A0ACB9EBU9_9ASTR|nr:hypothetical protein L1987_56122 [Smallanthus sonchifolius]
MFSRFWEDAFYCDSVARTGDADSDLQVYNGFHPRSSSPPLTFCCVLVGLSMGLRFSNGSDPEPWRCRRTDGKKWRCSKDVAPDQKYCERHTRKTRSRSRKPVETQSHNTKDYPTVLSAANQQTECSDWFMKNAGIPVYQSNNRFQVHSPIGGSNSKQECSLSLSMQSGGNEMEFGDESFQMAVGMLSGDSGSEDVFKPHHHWLNQGSWGCSGSTPGGPLGEALRLGITTTPNEPSTHGYSYRTTTSSSCEGGGLNFVNKHDDY